MLIVQFMAPQPAGTWSDDQVDDLFASLFGRAETIHLPARESEHGEHDEPVAGTDFRIFA